MTDTELEQLLNATLRELYSAMDDMTDEDICQVRNHPVVRYIVYRVLPPAERREHFPAAEEYYQAQARMADRRWKFQCQKTSVA
jgi:hypothetical protein